MEVRIRKREITTNNVKTAREIRREIEQNGKTEEQEKKGGREKGREGRDVKKGKDQRRERS